MKKLLVAFTAVMVGILAVKAEYLKWYVNDDMAGMGTTDYTSTLYGFAKGDGSNPIAFGGATGEGTWTGGKDTASVAGFNASEATYYIEIGSYNASNEYVADHYVGGFTYQDLQTAAASAAQFRTIWANVVQNGGSHPNGVPEPTSGLMVLVGMAMLGLRRRRA